VYYRSDGGLASDGYSLALAFEKHGPGKLGAWRTSVSGICTSELRSFGERLRDYGINGC